MEHGTRIEDICPMEHGGYSIAMFNQAEKSPPAMKRRLRAQKVLSFAVPVKVPWLHRCPVSGMVGSGIQWNSCKTSIAG